MRVGLSVGLRERYDTKCDGRLRDECERGIVRDGVVIKENTLVSRFRRRYHYI